MPLKTIGRILPRSISSRLFLILAVVFGLTMATEVRHYYAMFTERRAEGLQANLEVARGVATTFEAYVENILNQEFGAGLALTYPEPLSSEHANRVLAATANQVPSIYRYNWLSPQGQVVASSDPQSVGADLSDRPAFQEIVKGQEWSVSDLLLARPGDEPVFVIARGVRDERGALRGIVWALVNPQGLGSVLHIERGGQAAIVIADSRGWVVYRYPEVRMAWDDRDWVETEPIIAKALAGEEATGDTIAPPGFSADKSLLGVVPIRSIGWVAGASRPEAAVTAPLYQELLREAGEVLAVIAVAFLVALLIGRTIISPVRRLREHALALARGGLGRSAEVAGPVEIEEAASAFNTMAEEIRRRERELQASLAFLQVLIDAIPVPIFYKDAEGLYRGSNAAFQAMLGRAKDEIVDKSVYDLSPKHLADVYRRADLELFGRGGIQTYETRVAYADGVEHDVIFYKATFPNPDGSLGGLVGTILDITERKRAERELATSRDFYLTLFDEFPALIWRAGVDAKCNYFNKAWLSFTGRAMEQELGDGWTEGVHRDDLERCVRTYLDAFHARQPFEMEYRLRRHDGEYRWIIDIGRPFTNLDGSFAGYVGSCYDITERKRTEQLREEYVHTISHDLRAPLTIIQGHAQLLDQAMGNALVGGLPMRSTQAILTSTRRMGAMLEDLVDAVRIEAGQLRANTRPLDLRAFILDLTERMATTGGERIQVEAPEDLPKVLADPDRLERVLTNLVTNALKYSAPDTSITISLCQRDGEVITAVSDQGPGIPPEMLAHLFERYYRTSLARERREGLGLGLYITKGLVEAQGGRVWVESEVGKGSTFYVSLPVA